MSRRERTKRQYRRALVPGLVLSVVAHALVLGLGGFDVPLWDDGETAEEDRVERFEESSLQVVAIRSPTAARQRASDDAGEAGSPLRSVARPSGAAAPAVRPPSSRNVTVEPVRRPTAVPTLRPDERRRGRLSATDLATLYPGSNEMPRPTSRAAREASGEHRDVGDRFEAVGGTRRAGPSGGSCTGAPGAIVDRRFPQDIPSGGI